MARDETENILKVSDTEKILLNEIIEDVILNQAIEDVIAAGYTHVQLKSVKGFTEALQELQERLSKGSNSGS